MVTVIGQTWMKRGCTHGGGDGVSVVSRGGNEESVGQRATALHLGSALFKPKYGSHSGLVGLRNLDPLISKVLSLDGAPCSC